MWRTPADLLDLHCAGDDNGERQTTHSLSTTIMAVSLSSPPLPPQRRRFPLTRPRLLRPLTPGRCSKACTRAPPAYCLPPARLLTSPQRRQRHRRAPQVGRDRVQGQTRLSRPLYEYPASQHGGIRRRRQLRYPRPGPDPL